MAMDRVDEGDCQGLFFMNTVKPEDVEEVAYTGEKNAPKIDLLLPQNILRSGHKRFGQIIYSRA